MHKNPVRGGGGEALVNTGFAAHCGTCKSAGSLRVKKAVLAIVTAALLFVCGVFGGLSWLPVAGGVLKPLKVRAAENLNGHYTLTNSTTLTHSGGTSIMFDSLTEFTLTGDTVIDLTGNTLTCASISGGSSYDLTILGAASGSAIIIDSSSVNKSAIEANNVTISSLNGAGSKITTAGDNHQGILAWNSLVIDTGDGGLEVISSGNTAPAVFAVGGDVTISGKGGITAQGSTGLGSRSGSVFINNTQVTATGNGTNVGDWGITAGYLAGSVVISGSQVTATSRSEEPAIAAGININIIDSVVTATASNAAAGPAIGHHATAHGGDITFSGVHTVVTAQTGNTGGIISAIQITGSSGKISISVPLGITTPAPPDGVLSANQRGIMNGSVAANYVVIQNTGGGSGGGGTPTPTPTPTPSPTPTPTEPTWKKLPSTISDGTDRADGNTGLSVTAGSVPDLTITPLPHADGTTAGGFHSLKIGDDFHGPAHFTLDGNVITIHPSILNTLAEGMYIIRINYDNYTYTESKLMVLGATRPANMTRVDPPQTSDANTPVMTGFGILFLLSFAGMCAIAWRSRRIR